mmetsp:Transcript_33096/g.69652  ORF Transcript_33096/g.69652 Transcript_33096/m.69652 type:complete len:344 (-) Transcript_33096:114-1145(-)
MIINRQTGGSSINMAAFLLLALAAVAPLKIEAFTISSNRMCNRRSILGGSIYNDELASPVKYNGKEMEKSVLFMSEDDDDDDEEGEEQVDEEEEEDEVTTNDDDDDEDHPSKALTTYKSNLNPRRISYDDRPGSSRPQASIDVTMKFGGSSLANSECIDRVAKLIRDRIRPPLNEDGSVSEEVPVRPRAVICSAMGKTTNSLLSAGQMALEEGRVDIEALRTLHLGTCQDFELPTHTRKMVGKLLDECEDMLNGVRLIQELSPKSLDQLVSYGERCSVRIMAARLNQLGVPAQAFDAWDVGVFTDDTYGDAKLLPKAIESIKERFGSRIDPNVVAVVTGFIGE